jgi:peptide deformylase
VPAQLTGSLEKISQSRSKSNAGKAKGGERERRREETELTSISNKNIIKGVEPGILKICKYGDDVLKTKARKIRDIDGHIAGLAAAMVQTMHQAPGIGLAAPQVSESVQLITVDLSVGENPEELLVLINPLILEAEGYEISEEGCLSVPGYSLAIKRNARILLQGTLIDGRELRAEFDGLKARVLQHEIDHLAGVLIVDRLSSLKRTLVKKEINQKRKSGQW